MDKKSEQIIIDNYKNLFLKYGSGPEVGQWSPEGQRFRFEKLIQIADLKGRNVLDLGCGIGDLYPFLIEKFNKINFTGIDIVPEVITSAIQRYPEARFFCRNILQDDFDETFDYVLISGMFNNAIPDSGSLLKEIITWAYHHCSLGIGFNFISTYVNFTDPEMAYHDPIDVLDFCLKNLTRKVTMYHHYNRADVVVFAYR
jgi:SAM-dependent methyltransferase